MQQPIAAHMPLNLLSESEGEEFGREHDEAAVEKEFSEGERDGREDEIRVRFVQKTAHGPGHIAYCYGVLDGA